MTLKMIVLPLAALASLATPALAVETGTAAAAKARPASIPFANYRGVRDWTAPDDRTIYFEDAHRQWYRATLFTPAFDLPFSINIGIIPSPGGSLDRWSAVSVRGQRYAFDTFEKVDGPPARKAKAEKAG